MNIETMTKQDFQNLKYLDELHEIEIPEDRLVNVDSIVLLPTRHMDSSGYRIFEVIPCNFLKPLGKARGYDTFSIIMESKYNAVGIDCLKCGLMRIFLPTHEYVLDDWLHQIIKK